MVSNNFLNDMVLRVWSWSQALRRAKWYLQECEARDVRIIWLDMEKLEPAIDAYAFATRYYFAKGYLHRFGHLYHGTIPEEAVMTVVRATSRRQNFRLETGVFSTPGGLAWVSVTT